MHDISNRHFECRLIRMDTTSAIPLLIIQREDDYDNDTGKPVHLNPDTLIDKFHGFIEYNPTPRKIKIESIKFSRSPCYGTCPVFDLTIKQDKKAVLIAKEYNEQNGTFRATLDDQTFADIMAIISYMNIDQLKSNYKIGWTDNPSVDLEISYDGKIKKIHDYGLEGTFGLKQLYRVLTGLPKTHFF